MFTLLFATIFVTLQQPTFAADDDMQCTEGFVMDLFCINRGTLLDAPSVVTLQNPERHSVHCLVDVSRCINSGYNILLPNPKFGQGSEPKFGYALTLDKTGDDLVLKFARENGVCSTCTGSGKITAGLRFTYIGKVIPQGDDVAIFQVKNISLSPRIADPNSSDDGCPNAMKRVNTSTLVIKTESGDLQDPSIAHGSLMIISWGFLLPTGVVSAHFLKHRPNALWFKAHRIVQIVGLIIAICGWAVALHYFEVIESDDRDRAFSHAAMGMTVMILALLQPINALIRPHPPEKGEARALKRLIWEIVHKCSGYIAIILAAVTIVFGTYIIFDHGAKFRAAWGVTVGWVVSFSILCWVDGYMYKKRGSNSSSISKSHNDL